MSMKVNPFYNIEAPVGPRQTNRPDDVALVQYLLVKVATVTAGGRWKPPAMPLAVDGTYTPNLGDWIMSYQKVTRGVNDGVLHPQINQHWKKTTYSTIVSLNASYRAHFGGARHDNLVAEPDCPVSLRMALSPANSQPEMGTKA